MMANGGIEPRPVPDGRPRPGYWGQISTDQHRNFPAEGLMSPLPVCRVWGGVDAPAAPFLGPQRRPYAPRADGRIWNKTRCNVQLTAR
jgi:hypothetical protein